MTSTPASHLEQDGGDLPHLVEPLGLLLVQVEAEEGETPAGGATDLELPVTKYDEDHFRLLVVT